VVLRLYFHTVVLNLARVHVLAVHGLNHVVALDIKQVRAIRETAETKATSIIILVAYIFSLVFE
jgi:hypothetical protein